MSNEPKQEKPAGMQEMLDEIHAVARDMEYDAPPRGRVVYDTAGQHFHLYADVCILRNETLLAKIRSDLHLPPEVEAAPDDHYRCAKCLAASPSDKDL